MTDPREDKLPAWAREVLRLARLRADVAEKSLAAHTETAPKSRLWHGDYSDRIYLPDDREVVHWQMGSESVREQISVSLVERNGLRIHGGNVILIKPASSNVVYIKLAE